MQPALGSRTVKEWGLGNESEQACQPGEQTQLLRAVVPTHLPIRQGHNDVASTTDTTARLSVRIPCFLQLAENPHSNI